MGWERESAKWRKGKIGEFADKEDVLRWLENDEIWNKANKVTIDRGSGSHCANIYIAGISQLIPRWDGDSFQVSTVSGRKVKKWIVEQLVKAYEQLETL